MEQTGSIMKKWIIPVLRLAMGLIFIYASIDKLRHPAAFAETVFNYQILPDVLVNFTAIVLPCLELLLGICVIAGIWLPGAAFSINLLLSVFFFALLFNLARGLDVHCGCFSATAEAEKTEGISTVFYVIRDGFFLAGSMFLVFLLYRQNRKTS